MNKESRRQAGIVAQSDEIESQLRRSDAHIPTETDLSFVEGDEPKEEPRTAHSPGPWDYDDTHDGCCGSPCTPNGCHESHPTGTYYLDGPEMETEFGTPTVLNRFDAALIAAAPELLEAFKAMMRYYDTPCGPWELLAQARAAIAKAEGRS
jgi:hypothetical protein